MASLVLHIDIDCNVYVDTEFHGIAKANLEYSISLNNGIYWVECVALEDDSVRCDFDINTHNQPNDINKNITLIYNLRQNQLRAKYGYIGEFYEGFAEVRKDNKLIGFIDTSYQLRYDDVQVLCSNTIRVKQNDCYGVIDSEHNEVIPIKYSEITLLGCDIIRLKLNNRYCLSNICGEKLTALKYKSILYAENAIFALFFDKWIFVDITMQNVPMPNNVILYSTNNGLCSNFTNEKSESSKCGQPYITNLGIEGNNILIFQKDIQRIESSSFSNRREITNITIPESVNSIAEWAFDSCKSLTNITIPDSVNSIENGAFVGCDKISAFYGQCTSKDNRCIIKNGVLISFAPFGLEQYQIPDSVTEIGKHAFSSCYSLTSVTIPNSVTSIGDGAFRDCTSLTSVTIPDGVTSIGKNAFRNCPSLTSVTIPNSVTEIGEGAFCHCESLASITIPDSVTEIGHFAFSYCKNLKSVTIPNSVTEIGEDAFCHCESLASITVPDSVTEIGHFAFSYCKNLKSVTMSSNITSVGAGIFKDCNKIKEFRNTQTLNCNCSLIINNELVAFAPQSIIEHYEIPERVNAIGNAAFWGCSNLRSVIIPNSVVKIGPNAFRGCSSLNSITIPSSVINCAPCAFDRTKVYHESLYPAEIISEKCTQCNKILSSDLYVPHTSYELFIKHPYWGRFKNNIIPYDFENGIVIQRNNEIWYTSSNKQTIEFNNSFNTKMISNIYDKDFGIIVFEDDITEIPDKAFEKCKDLESIVLPNGVKHIGSSAFANCSNLRDIKIPNSIISIGIMTFADCSALKTIVFPESILEFNSDTLRNYSNTATINSKVIKSTKPHSFESVSDKYNKITLNRQINKEIIKTL